eukprot:TRINITY_DN67549_c14_g3_i1.p1 TRINITY_DN67549_c14_g3~~TRINITY_DN67549_c14_g3_i1.p1  ORF type:complete len:462 (-),score=265.18 TRINITY_DN67549_c14_g3_i1:1222-2607(-)
MGDEKKVDVDAALKAILADVERRDGHEEEFLQAVHEVVTTLRPLLEQEPKYVRVLRAMLEPERFIQFRVTWTDDKGRMRVNRGFRVQFNSALGPYKGGLRLHPSVYSGIVKFLGFEQIFKNALTGLPLGGGKGGSDFDPKGKSDAEVFRFCTAFMTELSRHIGKDTDVPAGDIGVGGREIGFLLGAYKRLTGDYQGGVLTGKAFGSGGSNIRPEATGYGLVYLTQQVLEESDDSLKGKTVLVSGSGNVAQYAAEKLLELGAKVVSLSDSSGTLHMPNGITGEQLEKVMQLKNEKRGRISEAESFIDGSEFLKGKRPWHIKADVALPCATQNEIDLNDAKKLIDNGVKILAEGANMPSTNDAVDAVKKAGVTFVPAKAANAGGVATSGLEMSQNSLRLQWSREEVDERLKNIMADIFKSMSEAAERIGRTGDYQAGANVAGFLRVADAMLTQGMVPPSISAL